MHLVDQSLLGVAMLCLLAVQVVVKRLSTGSILEAPASGLLVRAGNYVNLLFLLAINPLAAVLLIAGRLAATDPTHVVIVDARLLATLESAGLVLYGAGFLLMAWALVTLGQNYQLGGSTPRGSDKLVVDGPYRLVRHPMYTAALSIALGLACLTQSLAVFAVFCLYLALMLPLIPLEEAGLQQAYGDEFSAYRSRSGRLLPRLG